MSKKPTGDRGNCYPLVTIGVPTYNRIEGLRKTLESASLQDYQNLEIIVADNASHDEPSIAALIESYSDDERIHYHRHESNLGAIYNFEYIFRNAKGEYCIIFSDDDEYDNPAMISFAVESILRDPSASAVFGGVQYVDKSNSIFCTDDVPYGLDGALFSRIFRYMISDITDNLIYSLIRTSLIREYSFEKNVSTTEKFFILYLLSKGGINNSPGMSYKNNYSFKSASEQKQALNSPLEKSHTLVMYRKIITYLPIPHGLLFLALYTLIRAPKISWPVRKLFGLPKPSASRVMIAPPSTK